MYGCFSTNNLITKNQCGFRSGDSTSNQLIEPFNEIHKSLDKRYEVRAVFLDICNLLTRSGMKEYYSN